MASRRNYLGKPNYRFHDNNLNSETMFEFDESNLWNSTNHHHVSASPDQFKKSIPSSRITTKIKSNNKRVENGDRVADGIARSLPVNIPDWSKILREDRSRRIGTQNYIDYDDDEDEDDETGRVPPHEFLARQLGRTQISSSFSVHEGIGRTLKGRDLSRVRDAIWEKTGFED